MGNYDQVSLGQGQGPKAEKLLSQGMERGMWVCLQNCHLSQSWMPVLERIVDMIDPEKVQKNFSSPWPALQLFFFWTVVLRFL